MGKNQDPGSGIRDKHPGSATLFQHFKKMLLYKVSMPNQNHLKHIIFFLNVEITVPNAGLASLRRARLKLPSA
jgi:hypothetical protein